MILIASKATNCKFESKMRLKVRANFIIQIDEVISINLTNVVTGKPITLTGLMSRTGEPM